MPRPRKPENRGLPLRWKHQHGAYYYQVPRGLEHLWEGKKLYRLGSTLPEAHKEWAKRLENSTNKASTINQLLDRYALEVVPTKAPKTRIENIRQIATLREVFGTAPLSSVKPQYVYQYLDKREAKVAARREIAVLSHALTKAVEWGYIDKHPFKGEIRLPGEAPRTRYVEDWEILEALSLEPKRGKDATLKVQAYIRLKLLTGMSKGDLLRLKVDQASDEGIRVTRHKTAKKTGKTTIYEWTEELRKVWDQALKVRNVHISPYVFCTRRGQSYIDEETGDPSGWDSIWKRYMDRVLKETKVSDRFTDHDLRAKCASDTDLEHARALLAHVDSRITQRVYRRKPERVKPRH